MRNQLQKLSTWKIKPRTRKLLKKKIKDTYLGTEPKLPGQVILQNILRELDTEAACHSLVAQHLVHDLTSYVQYSILENK